MKFRIVTATLAVALGAWSGGIVFAQAQQKVTPENTAQEGVLDFVAPARGLDSTLQSDLPLQGFFDDPTIQWSIPESLQSPQAPQDGGWMDTLRRRLYNASRPEIAMASAGLFASFVMVGWAIAAAASRRRARRGAYRRFPRSSGGSRVKGLEQVVASVQLGRTKPAAHACSVTGRSGHADA
jgi:hypothetical protein